MDPETSFDGKHRMVNPDLAGGALLDLGIYSLTWVFWALYNTQKNPKPPTVQSSLRKMESGVDQVTTMLLTFPREKEGDAHGIATTGMRVATDPNQKGEAPAVRIQGEKGEVMIYPPIFRPTRSKLVLADGTVEEKNWPQPGAGKGSGFYNGFGGDNNQEGEGHGMFWEADECAYAIRDGRKEGQNESLEESLVIMKVMDEVRRQGGMKLPDKIETTDYPVNL
jgi:predicted dehydrogenase